MAGPPPSSMHVGLNSRQCLIGTCIAASRTRQNPERLVRGEETSVGELVQKRERHLQNLSPPARTAALRTSFRFRMPCRPVHIDNSQTQLIPLKAKRTESGRDRRTLQLTRANQNIIRSSNIRQAYRTRLNSLKQPPASPTTIGEVVASSPAPHLTPYYSIET